MYPRLAFLLAASVTVAGAQIYPFAGTGVAGSAGIGGDSHQLQLNNPYGIALDPGYNAFIADAGNNRVVRVAQGSFTTMVYAGNGQAASSGDGGPASLASLNAPVGLAMDASQNLYISEVGGNRIRKVDAAYGTITTIAGTGSDVSSGDGGPATAAGLSHPAGLAYVSGILYVVESGRSLRRIDLATGIITTVADTTTGLISPQWATVEDYLNGVQHVLVGDMGSHTILRVDPTNGAVTTFAGNGTTGFTGDGIAALNTGMGYGMLTIYNDQGGGLFIADPGLNRIRRVDRDTGIIETVAGNGFSQPLTPDTGVPATSTALQSLHFIIAGPNGYTLFSDGNNRVWRLVLPSPYSYPYTATTASANPSSPNAGQSMTLSATVTPVGTSTVPTGSVSFQDGLGNPIGSAPLSGGTATLNTTAPPVAGSYTVTAVYSGDSSFYSSTSPVLAVTVQGAKAGTTISASTNPTTSGAGQGFYVFATVTPSGSATAPVTGPVQVLEGSNVLGTASVQSGGTAYVLVTLSTTGTHTLTAVYSGDSNYLGSTSAPFTQQVKAVATGTIATSLNPSTAGGAITFTVTVYQSAATGSIQFNDAATAGGNPVTLASVPISAGQAVFTTSTLSVGAHYISATYNGDSTYNGFTTSYFIQTVNQDGTTTALTPSLNPATPGTAVTFQTTVAVSMPSSAQPSGTVQLLDGTTVLTSANVSNGIAQLSYAFGTTGSHSLTAVYSGDANFAGSTSAVLSESVKSQSSTVLSASPNPSTDGTQVTFTATVQQAGASGTVDLLDGTVTLGSAALSSGSATFTAALTAGTHNLTANYHGDSSFQPSSATLTQVVKANTTTALAANPTSATVGQAVQFAATVTPAAATGSVQFFDGGTALGTAAVSSGVAVLSVSTLAAGTHNVNSLYSGDAGYASSSSAYAGVTISKVASSVVVVSSSNPSASGGSVTFTATVSPSAATGTVQFLDGGAVLGTAALSGGTASFSTASLAAGTHSITAEYSGDPTYNKASASLAQTVKAATTTALSASSTSITAGQAVQLTAWVTPSAATGTVQFLDGATALGTVALSGGTASLPVSTLAVGSHTITAAYSGDGSNGQSTSAAVSVTVSKAGATAAVTSSLNPSISGQAVTFTATVSPSAATGTVQFLDGATVLGTAALSGGTAPFSTASLAAGSHSITAAYSGDPTYNTASASLTQVVKAITTTAVTSNSATVISGQTVQFTAAVSPGTATGSVQFRDGSNILGTATLSGGIATYSTAGLAVGTHSITAVYGGDASDAGSSSAVYTETVNAPLPGAPSSLTAAAVSPSQINLTWIASPTSGVTYNVYASGISGFAPSASNRIAAGLTGTTYAATGLAPSTTVYYLVTAQNANGESSPSNQAGATTKGGLSCHVGYSVTTQWNVGFGTAITIKNSGPTAINGWTLTWTWPGNQQITQSWNSSYQQSGASAALTNASWNGSIAAGATVSGIGFNASYSGANTAPTAFYLNGMLCK